MPLVKVNGIEMYYESHGEGVPLLLISGYSADHTSWSPLVPAFSKKYRTIVMDNRGVGQTVVPDGPFTIEDMADDVAGLMNSLKIEKAHVMGVSMGGRIAQALVLRHPQKVKGLVLCSTTAHVPPRTRFFLLTLAEALAKGDIIYEFNDKMMLSWTFSDRAFASPETMKRMLSGIASDRARPKPADMLRQLHAGQGFDTRALLGQIKAPTIVIHGSDDILFPLSYGRELAAGIQGARLVVLDGAAHTAYLEAADKFVPTAMGFLASVDALKA
jgi:3-oxoadipate enol-lactonase